MNNAHGHFLYRKLNRYVPLIPLVICGIFIFALTYCMISSINSQRQVWENRSLDPKIGKVQYQQYGNYYYCEGTTMIIESPNWSGGMTSVPNHKDCT